MTMTTTRVAARMAQLTTERVPFVHATVVRAQVPSSARAGDEAIVTGDGAIDGFVGGVCAEGSVRTAALGALHGGGPLLLRVLPEGEADFPESPGARVVVNPCLSGGALEIFLAPMLPPPLIEIVGRTPVADALVAIAEVLGYATRRSLPDGGLAEHTDAVIVASHGRDEIESLRAALDAEVGYVALVASPRRGKTLLDELGLTGAARERISTPAGLDIGARTAPEVALSILAEVVTAVRRGPGPGAGADTDTGAAAGTCAPAAGMPVADVPVSGAPAAGVAASGIPAPGVPASGTPGSGAPGSGAPGSGAAVADAPVSGASAAGAPGSGVAAADAPVAGASGSGAAVADAPVAGASGSGAAVADAPVSGAPGSGTPGSGVAAADAPAAGAPTADGAPPPDATVAGGRAPAAPTASTATASTAVSPTTVTDPVCGMSVLVMPDTPHLSVDGTDLWFCATGCRTRYMAGR